MPRTFLVKKFKKQDAHTAVYNLEKGEKERRYSNAVKPRLLQNYQIACLHKGDNETRTNIRWEENTQGSPKTLRKRRTAIFMPISKKGSREDQSESQEKKRAKFESILVENEGGKADITELTHLTRNTKKQDKRIFYQETDSTTMKIQKGDDKVDIRMISSLKFNDPRVNGDYDKIESQRIKRPVALLPDRCTCTECQIRKTFYLRRYACSKKQFEIETRSISKADKVRCSEFESDFDVSQGRECSFFIDPLAVERHEAPTREEEIRGTEHCYQRKLSGIEISNDPQEQYNIVKQNYQYWQQRKSNPERIKEENTILVYSNEKRLDGESPTSKEGKKSDRMTETKAAEAAIGRGDIFDHQQKVCHLQSQGNEVSNAEMNIRNYRRKEEFCDCRKCIKSNTNLSVVTRKHGLGQWLKKDPRYYELNGHIMRKTRIKEETQSSQKGILSPWMKIGKTELENKNSDEKYESCIEDYDVINGYDEPFVAKKSDSFLVTKGISRNCSKGGIRFDVKSCGKKSQKPWISEELAPERKNMELASRDEKETEAEYDMKCEELSKMEAFFISRKDLENANGKDKKTLGKQHKEKDSGKKSRALANWLERKRVAELNDAFERLRRMVPTYGNEDRSLSKIKTLRYAATYIRHLALINEKQCRYGIEDVKKGLMKVLEMDPMLQRCHEHLESNCII